MEKRDTAKQNIDQSAEKDMEDLMREQLRDVRMEKSDTKVAIRALERLVMDEVIDLHDDIPKIMQKLRDHLKKLEV